METMPKVYLSASKYLLNCSCIIQVFSEPQVSNSTEKRISYLEISTAEESVVLCSILHMNDDKIAAVLDLWDHDHGFFFT